MSNREHRWKFLPAVILMTGCAAGNLSRRSEPPTSIRWQSITHPTTIQVPATVAHDAYSISIERDSSRPGYFGAIGFVITKVDTQGHAYAPDGIRISSLDPLEIALGDVTGDGLEEMITRGRSGRYAEEIVHVWVWTEARFERILDLFLGSRHDDSSPWYTVEFIDPDRDGVLDVLLLPAGPERPVSPTAENQLYPPNRGNLLYKYNSGTGRMELVDESSNYGSQPTGGAPSSRASRSIRTVRAAGG